MVYVRAKSPKHSINLTWSSLCAGWEALTHGWNRERKISEATTQSTKTMNFGNLVAHRPDLNAAITKVFTWSRVKFSVHSNSKLNYFKIVRSCTAHRLKRKVLIAGMYVVQLSRQGKTEAHQMVICICVTVVSGTARPVEKKKYLFTLRFINPNSDHQTCYTSEFMHFNWHDW